MPNTDEQPGWLQLLETLSDDELHRYGEIAADQKRLEWGHAWAQVACILGALAAAVWFVRESIVNGVSWSGGVALGLALALGYWPYRKAIVRRLWQRHCVAVEREQALRRKGKDTDQAKGV